MATDSPQSPAEGSPRPRQRGRWQFGLSTLLLLVTACAFGSWWYSQESWEAFQQRFTKKVEQLGGYIEWASDESPTKLSFRNRGPWVEHNKKALSDEQLGRLRRDLGRLGPFTLNLCGSPDARGAITDAGLEHLKGVARLECLCLRHTDITDVGLGRLSRINGLQFVDLRDTVVTGEGVHEAVSHSTFVVCSDVGHAVSSETNSAKWKPPDATHVADGSAAGLPRSFRSLCFQARATGELATVDVPRSESLRAIRSAFVSPNDVVVSLHHGNSDSGVQIARIDLAVSPIKVVWAAFAQPLGVDHSQYRHNVQIFVQEDRCVVVSDGAETFVEIRDLATGSLLKRWVY